MVSIHSGADACGRLEPGAETEEVGLRSRLPGHSRRAPTRGVAVGRQGQRIPGAGADGDGGRHPWWDGYLLLGGVSPGEQTSLSGKGQSVVVAGRDSGDA